MTEPQMVRVAARGRWVHGWVLAQRMPPLWVPWYIQGVVSGWRGQGAWQSSGQGGEDCAVGLLCDLVKLLGLCRHQCAHLPESCEEGLRTHLRKICAVLQAWRGMGSPQVTRCGTLRAEDKAQGV